MRARRRFANHIGLPNPHLTRKQTGAQVVKNVKMASGILGVMVGCVFGMLPLLIMKRDESANYEAKKAAAAAAAAAAT